jgi:hypothetical protein
MGKRKAPVLDPETTARKVAAMAVGRAAAHQERLAAETALLAGLADMPLEELTRHANGRQFMTAVWRPLARRRRRLPARSGSGAAASRPIACGSTPSSSGSSRSSAPTS